MSNIIIPERKPNTTENEMTTESTAAVVIDQGVSTQQSVAKEHGNPLGIVLMLVFILWGVWRLKKSIMERRARKEQDQQRLLLSQRMEAAIIDGSYFTEVNTIGFSATLTQGFNFVNGEKPYFVSPATYCEDKVSREFISGSSGFGIRVAKGVTYRVGGSRGKSIEKTSIKYVGKGTLVITNKHVYFKSSAKSLRIHLSKIVTYDGSGNHLAVQRDAVTALPQYFIVDGMGYVMHMIMDAMTSGDYEMAAKTEEVPETSTSYIVMGEQ